jgi:hypothetical protein
MLSIRRSLAAWAIALSLAFPADRCKAESAVLTPSADASLIEVSPNNSAGGSGFFLSGTTQNRTMNRALLQFDIASAIPAGSQITSVGLQLEVTRQPSDGFEASLFGLHRMLRSWGEGGTVVTENPGGLGAPAGPGDATWAHRFAFDTPWAMPGGAAGTDFAPTFSSSTIIYGVDVYNFEGTLDMIADVQAWLDNPGTNFGWMLKSQSEELPFTARRFASREDPNGAGPLLFIEYQLIPEPGTWALLGTAAVVFGIPSLRRKLIRR